MKIKKSKEKTNSFAIASFILALIPWVSMLFPKLPDLIIGEVPASIYPVALFLEIPVLSSILFGVIALVKIRKNKSLKGREFAIAGIVLSTLAVLIIIVSFILLARSLSQL